MRAIVCVWLAFLNLIFLGKKKKKERKGLEVLMGTMVVARG